MASTTESTDDKNLILRVAYLNSRDVKQSDIAEQLKISVSMVSRLIKQSYKYVRLQYDMPRETELETMLIKKFKLIHAVVVETGGLETEIDVIGQHAAGFFNEKVKNGDSVAHSCGETLLSMIQSLPTRLDRTLKITQLSIECDPKYIHQAPATLAGILRSKSGSNSTVYGIQLLPPGMLESDTKYREELAKSSEMAKMRQQAANSKFIFIGIGAPNRKSGAQERLINTIGAKNKKALLKSLKSNGIVSEINNRMLNTSGEDLTNDIPEIADRIVSILSTEQIRATCIAARKQKPQDARYVVAVATGIAKALAIKVVLLSCLANVIITSRETAESILDL